jgi:hypothetical protein
MLSLLVMIPFIHSVIALVTHSHMTKRQVRFNPRLTYELVSISWLFIVLTGAYFRADHALINTILLVFVFWFIRTKQHKIMWGGIKEFVTWAAKFKAVFGCFILCSIPRIADAIRVLI